MTITFWQPVRMHPARREHSTRCSATQTGSGGGRGICSASQWTFPIGFWAVELFGSVRARQTLWKEQRVQTLPDDCGLGMRYRKHRPAISDGDHGKWANRCTFQQSADVRSKEFAESREKRVE